MQARARAKYEPTFSYHKIICRLFRANRLASGRYDRLGCFGQFVLVLQSALVCLYTQTNLLMQRRASGVCHPMYSYSYEYTNLVSPKIPNSTLAFACSWTFMKLSTLQCNSSCRRSTHSFYYSCAHVQRMHRAIRADWTRNSTDQLWLLRDARIERYSTLLMCSCALTISNIADCATKLLL